MSKYHDHLITGHFTVPGALKEVNIIYETPHTYYSLKENQKYDLKDDHEVVEINQFDDQCFQINSTLMNQIEQRHYRMIYIQMIEPDEDDMPEFINVYFTSEVNSYGAYLDWWDGNVFRQRLDWKKFVLVNLKPFEYRYLGDDLKCSQQSNFFRFKMLLKDTNFTNCPKKCSPLYFVNDIFPPCGWEDDNAIIGPIIYKSI